MLLVVAAAVMVVLMVADVSLFGGKGTIVVTENVVEKMSSS